MSLHEAVKMIAENMLAKEQPSNDAGVIRLFYAGQLMAALKASGPTPSFSSSPATPPTPSAAELIAREALRTQRRQADAEESLNGRMSELVGGASDGTFASLPPEMPVGAKTLLGDEVYELKEDRKMYFSQELTTKYHEGQPKAP